MDVVGNILKKTVILKIKCSFFLWVCVFLRGGGTTIRTAERKIKIWQKTILSKRKIFRFNEEIKVKLSRKKIEEEQKRKYVNVKINGIKIKLQLDTGNDLSIINVLTWKQEALCWKKKQTNRVARGASGNKLNFKGEFMCHISYLEKTLKSKVYVLQNTSDLFGNDCIVLFDLWQLSINSYCNRVDISSKSKNKETEKLVEDLKNSFPWVFSEGLGNCVKTKVKFKLKENV